MHSIQETLAQRAKTWFNLSLFNTANAGQYFEYLVESIDPMVSLLDYKARVLKVIEETEDTKTWLLQPHSSWQGFKAGQHIHITVEKNGVRHTRTFTLSSSPQQWNNQGTIAITVKRVPDGLVTPWMHEALTDADIISISAATGDFTLPADAKGPIGYLAAGSGITPIMSHLRDQCDRGMPLSATLIYFANTQNDFIFGEELRALATTKPRLNAHFVASHDKKKNTGKLPQSLLSAAHIEALLKAKPTSIYLCGPLPFRTLAKELLAEKGFDLAKVREEAFGLPPIVASPDGGPVTVNFSESDVQTTTDQPGTLLDMAESAGLAPTAGCRMGICHTCKCTKKSGQVRDVISGQISSSEEEDIRLCVSTPISNVEIEL